MIKLIQKILYAFIACGIVLGFFPISSKEKEPEHRPESPEINANQHESKKKDADDEPAENADDFDLEEEEEKIEEMMPQPKRRKERDGEPE